MIKTFLGEASTPQIPIMKEEAILKTLSNLWIPLQAQLQERTLLVFKMYIDHFNEEFFF